MKKVIKNYLVFLLLLVELASIGCCREMGTSLLQGAVCDYRSPCLVKFSCWLGADLDREFRVIDSELATDGRRHSLSYTPLIGALNLGQEDIAKMLVMKGADTNKKNSYGRNPLAEAIRKCSKPMVLYLLEKGANPDQGSLVGAAGNNDKDLAVLLLSKGASINRGYGDNSTTPLMQSIERGHSNLAQFFIDRKADVNVKDKNGKSTLTYAIEANTYDVSKSLLEHGARVEYPEVSAAVKAGSVNFLKLLRRRMGYGVLVDIVQSCETVPKAGKLKRWLTEHPEHIGVLAKLNMDIDRIDEIDEIDQFEQRIPMIHLAQHSETVDFLAELKIDIDQIDVLDKIDPFNEIWQKYQDETALHRAARNKSVEVVEALLKNGADVHLKNIHGETPLAIVVKGYRSVSSILRTGPYVSGYTDEEWEIGQYTDEEWKIVGGGRGGNSVEERHRAADEITRKKVKVLIENGARLEDLNVRAKKVVEAMITE